MGYATERPGFETEELIAGLEAALFARDIRKGFCLLDASFTELALASAPPLESVSLLLCIAQWADLGYQNRALLAHFRARLAATDKAQLRLLDYLRLRITEAYELLAGEHPEGTIEVLDLVLRMEGGLLDDYLQFLVNFWKGRASKAG